MIHVDDTILKFYMPPEMCGDIRNYTNPLTQWKQKAQAILNICELFMYLDIHCMTN